MPTAILLHQRVWSSFESIIYNKSCSRGRVVYGIFHHAVTVHPGIVQLILDKSHTNHLTIKKSPSVLMCFNHPQLVQNPILHVFKVQSSTHQMCLAKKTCVMLRSLGLPIPLRHVLPPWNARRLSTPACPSPRSR